MRIIRSTSLLALLAAGLLLTGCGSTGMGDVLGGSRDRTTTGPSNDPYGENRNVADLQGTVERVSTQNRYIVIDPENDNYAYNLRNGSGENEVIVYFDDRTPVEYQGRTFKPADLEPGDRVRVDLERSGDRLLAQQIQVMYDVTGGTGDRYGDNSTGTNPYDRNDNDRYNDRYEDSNRYGNDLRGTVRNVDIRNRTVEIERSQSGTLGRSDIVLVRYDTNTTVEFQGRNYSPENLERGDVVEISGRPLNPD
jgi:hypothetical protein